MTSVQIPGVQFLLEKLKKDNRDANVSVEPAAVSPQCFHITVSLDGCTSLSSIFGQLEGIKVYDVTAFCDKVILHCHLLNSQVNA